MSLTARCGRPDVAAIFVECLTSVSLVIVTAPAATNKQIMASRCWCGNFGDVIDVELSVVRSKPIVNCMT